MSESRAADAPSDRLPPLLYWGVFAVALGVFLFGEGPVWSHPWSIDSFDLAVYWSYLPIPLLIFAGLAWSRRLRLRSFLLNTMELTLLKYSVTFTIALFLWETQAAPGLDTSVVHPAPGPVEALPTPTPIPPGTTGVIEGRVEGLAGRPAAGALVFVESGLEAYVFAPPAEPLRLENHGAGVEPRLSAAQAGQTILARSTDGHLHSVVASRAGEALFHIPMLSSGAWSTVVVREPHGVAELGCTVHQGSELETRSHLAVFAHPFFTLTREDGTFQLAGVPQGALRVGAWDRAGARISVTIDLEAGKTQTITLALPPS
jgi:hypothetical protein